MAVYAKIMQDRAVAGCLTITEEQRFARRLNERVGGIRMDTEFIQLLPRSKHNCQERSGDHDHVKQAGVIFLGPYEYATTLSNLFLDLWFTT